MVHDSEIENNSIPDSPGAASGLTEASSTALVRRSPRKSKANTNINILKNMYESDVETSIDGDDLDEDCSPNVYGDSDDESIMEKNNKPYKNDGLILIKSHQYNNKKNYKDQLLADKKASTNRGRNFTEEEDFFIATAWVYASENNIQGANQTSFDFLKDFESKYYYIFMKKYPTMPEHLIMKHRNLLSTWFQKKLKLILLK